MSPSECAQYWAFGVVLGFGLRWLWRLVELLFSVPSVIIGRE